MHEFFTSQKSFPVVLINGNRFECYFQNSPLVSDGPGEGLIREDYVAGWSGMRQVNKKSIEAFPNVNFDDPRIHTADMSGDGLQDIVEISTATFTKNPYKPSGIPEF